MGSTILHGHRTLPTTIDELARLSGSSEWARYTPSSQAFVKGDFKIVTFWMLANAINRLSWRFAEVLHQLQEGEAICYIGSTDLRYFVVACAACKVGLTALFSSPRNNLEAHQSLLDKTKCRILLGSETTTPLPRVGIRYESIPSIDHLFDATPVSPFSWHKTFEDVAHEPFLILHTTGSTGLPKPISISHGLIATIDAQQMLPRISGRQVVSRLWANRAVYTALPPFHSAGINFFCFSIFQSTKLIFGPPDQPPSLSTIDQMLDLHIADAAVIPPALLVEVSQSEATMKKISRWSSVAYGGGALSQQAGDALWQYTKVLHILGSTETFNLPELEPRSIDEWMYHHYHPVLNIDFRPSSDNLSELVFLRKTLLHQGAFWTFPDEQVYSMKDLYEQHPEKRSLWKYKGRLDDVVVLSNGEKFCPVTAEQIIAQEPCVKSALIVGNARQQAALLIEPSEKAPTEGRRSSIEMAVEKANDKLPAHAQIHPTHIRVLKSEAFLRSAKGEVRRAPTTGVLKDVIADIYSSADAQQGLDQLDSGDETALCESLTDTISHMVGKSLTCDENIFAKGFDSLLTLKLSRQIKNSFKSFDTRTIYQNPSAALLAHALVSGQEHTTSVEEMQELLDSYISRIDELEVKQSTSPQKTVVILTGSTGSLGSYILDSLLSNKTVHEIVCLNRIGSDVQKQLRANQSRGLSVDFSKVTFHQTDLSQTKLGLSDENYASLSRASHIIHNAWPVDFNLPLYSFRPQLESCHNLVGLASIFKISITFISSVGAANNWNAVHEGPVPEEVIHDLRVAETMGYAQSKQQAELLFVHAGEKGLPVTICRVGQIAGPVLKQEGVWNTQEWFPSMMRSCKKLGKIPNTLGAMNCIDWVPVDLLGNMLVEAALDKNSGVEVLHFVNPQRTNWQDIVDHLVDWQAGSIQVVSYEVWLDALKNAAEDPQCADQLPAVKLITFFSDIGEPEARRPVFSTSSTRETSTTLAELQAISVEWCKSWMAHWNTGLTTCCAT